MSEANTIHLRAADLIGEEAMRKLRLHSLVVVDEAAVQRFLTEHKASNARIRETAAACMRAAGCMTVRTEITLVEGNPTLIVTHPSGDEAEMAQAIAELMADIYHPEPGGRAPTDEDRAAKQRDTNDVDIYAKAGEEITAAERAEAVSYNQPHPPGSPEALAALNWPGHLGEPGERVLLLATQGFNGVGRKEAANRASSMAETCRDDAEAMRMLRHFQWNELADLPFPIREVLGFDKDGNPIDGDGSS